MQLVATNLNRLVSDSANLRNSQRSNGRHPHLGADRIAAEVGLDRAAAYHLRLPLQSGSGSRRGPTEGDRSVLVVPACDGSLVSEQIFTFRFRFG